MAVVSTDTEEKICFRFNQGYVKIRTANMFIK